MADKLGTKITLSEVASLQHVIEQAPAQTPTEVTKREAIGLLAPQLYELRSKGYAWRDVAALLTEHGVTVTVSALQRHLRTAKGRASGGSRKRKPGPGRAASENGRATSNAPLTLIAAAPVAAPSRVLKNVQSSGPLAPEAKMRSTEQEKRRADFVPRRDSDDI